MEATGTRRALVNRRAVQLCVLVAIALMLALAPPAGAVVGGSRISVEQAPWQAVVQARIKVGEPTVVHSCGGSILNENEVLTAAHCLFDSAAGTELPADDITVRAGTSDFDLEGQSEEQLSVASRLRIHPYYEPGAASASDDVAVVTLEKPLVLSRPTAKAIPLVSAGSILQEGIAVSFAGFGLENPVAADPDGTLNLIGMNLLSSHDCGGESDALVLCASTPTGSVCAEDSGSALTVTGASPALVGVAEAAQEISGKSCSDGAIGVFANVAAPEIRDFVMEDDLEPPRAPRGGSGVLIQGVVTAGYSLTCDSGPWSGGPTFTYTFINYTGGQVLQTGPSNTYALSSAAVGRSILCEVEATTAGGTGVASSGVLPPVRAAPASAGATNPDEPGVGGQEVEAPLVPDAKLASTTLQASSKGAVSIKVSCPTAGSSCVGTLTLSTLSPVSSTASAATKAKAADLTLAIGSFIVAAGKVKTVTLHLSVRARALLARAHQLRARATIVVRDPSGAKHTTETTVTLHAPKTAQ